MKRRWGTALAVAWMILIAACTPPERTVTSQAPLAPSPAPTSSPSGVVPLPEPPASASSLPGNLLVRTAAGGLQLVRPDGAAARVVVEGGSDEIVVLTAAWSPDGDRIAWSQIDALGDAAARVVWSDLDGGRRAEALVPFAPFYLSWDPTSSRVAFLGGNATFTLGIMERTNGQTAGRPLANGQPFYFSWAPDGERLVTHVDERLLDTVTLDGKIEHLVGVTGLFQAPVWTSDGETLVYAAVDEGLVARDVGTGEVRSLAPLDGGAFLVVSADGRRVAFHARGANEQDFYERDLPETATDLGVRVVGIAGGPETQVTEAPAIAWSWSPDGRRLAILEPVYDDDAIRFRWVVWDGTDTVAFEPFVATVGMQQGEVPFFSQFAQSATMWAPNSKAFAYAAELPDGTNAIWIQPVEADEAAYPVATGVGVSWSPVAGALTLSAGSIASIG
ncbi:MAG: hypothetical protein WD096_10790 [Actinomycetota bacterium]